MSNKQQTPDEGLLLTCREIEKALAKENFHAKELLPSFEYDFIIAKAQLAKCKKREGFYG